MLHDGSHHDTYICETDVDCYNMSGDTIRIIFGDENFVSTIVRLFLEDILEEKRNSGNDTGRISSLNDEEGKGEEEKINNIILDDDSSVLGS